jgi:hypothetical protein
VRTKDVPPLLKCARESKAKAAEYAADALSEPATLREDGSTPVRSWDISAHANELRSNGWNYVLKIARVETPEDPYWVKARFREFDTLKRELEYHFPYIMDSVKSPFPEKQKVKMNVALVVMERKRKLDVWLKDVALKQGLYESKELLEFLHRDDTVVFIDMKEFHKQQAEKLKSKVVDTVKNVTGNVKNVVVGNAVSAEQVAAAAASEEKLFAKEEDTSKLMVQIVGAQEQRAKAGNYMLYILEMKKAGKVWRLAHRYDDFFKLSSEICRAFPSKSVIRLPASKMLQKQTGRGALGTSMKVNEAMIEERKTTLWQFLQDCIGQKDIFDSTQFQQFVMPISAGLRDRVTRRLSMVQVQVKEASDKGAMKVVEGCLFKKGSKLSKAWKERYCVLDPYAQTLSYYTKKAGDDGLKGELHGEIHLRSVMNVKKLNEADAKSQKVPKDMFAFMLDEPDRTWYLAVDAAGGGEDQRKVWLDGLKHIMSVSGSEGLTKAGMVKKLVVGTLRKSWAERYLVLDPMRQTMMLFKDRGSNIQKEIYLKDITVCEELPSVLFPDVSNTFKVVTSTEMWQLSASDPVELESWVSTIREYMPAAEDSMKRKISMIAPMGLAAAGKKK